jgi:hypothetical protein
MGASIPYIRELLPLLFSPVSKVIFEKETSTSLKHLKFFRASRSIRIIFYLKILSLINFVLPHFYLIVLPIALVSLFICAPENPHVDTVLRAKKSRGNLDKIWVERTLRLENTKDLSQ